MNKSPLLVIVFAVLFLFAIQSAGTLVESIYILDLMNTNLDEKALGVLFFFTPLLALPFIKRFPRLLLWVLLGLLVLTRGLTPYLNTENRMITAGIATGAAFSLFFLLLATRPKLMRWGGAGLAMAVALSALLRAAGEGIEYSLVPDGGWVGWVLGLLLVVALLANPEHGPAASQKGVRRTAGILGIYLILTLVYFSISAPAVIARWTQGNYTLIASAIGLFSLGWTWLLANPPRFMQRISSLWLLVWNLLFTFSLTGTLLAHRVGFPAAADSPAVVISDPSWIVQIPLGLMLLLFPVLFLDLCAFLQRLQPVTAATSKKTKRTDPHEKLASGRVWPGILVGSLSLVTLIFVNIFSNVWAYIDPISLPFRNTFWLTYFILSAGITLLVWGGRRPKTSLKLEPVEKTHWIGAVVLVAILVGTILFTLPSARVEAGSAKTSLRAMTFNTQQSNGDDGEKSVDAQLALIRRVSPDILALQESDSALISLNNNDYVRYFAEKLGYYSYYGPTTGSGTFGTAILSKYPLLDTRSVFIYSDKDETGVAEAEIEVNGIRFTIYNVHPDSSDEAMMVFARTLVERAADKPYAIALGDYNLRDYEAAYQWIDMHLINAWTSVYSSEIGADGTDMSDDNRIDHIFLSINLQAVDPTYILPPESATDHPVHWTDITWEQ